tara:strand:+ start:1303 stop:2292 length:990 start_codon:yes stop_codon:yes gene_type:complete
MPTSSYFGRNSFVAAAAESTWGTANETYDIRRPIISCSMLRAVEKVPRANLQVAGVNGLRKGHYLVSETCSGTLELEMTYDNMGYFLTRLLGASTTGGGTVNTHTYTLGDVPDTGTTLALQRGTGDNYEVFEGCVLNTGTFSVAAGESMSLSMDLIAETGQTRKSSPSVSYTDPTNENLVLHHHLTSHGLAWNSQNITLIDFEFKVENAMSDRMRLGSLLTKQPVVSDYRNITCTVSFETDDATYASFISDAQSDLEVVFDNALSGANQRQIGFNLNNAYIESYTDEISETGLVTASVTFRGEADGSSGLALGASIVVLNEASTPVANG